MGLWGYFSIRIVCKNHFAFSLSLGKVIMMKRFLEQVQCTVNVPGIDFIQKFMNFKLKGRTIK